MADTLPDDPEAVADDHGNGDQHDDIAALLAILDAGIAADKEPVVVLSASFKAKAVFLLAKHLKIKDRTTPALRKIYPWDRIWQQANQGWNDASNVKRRP